jgi:hypothetical protein
VGGLLLLLATGELAPGNVLGFCVAASNAFGLIAGALLGRIPCGICCMQAQHFCLHAHVGF